MFERFTNRARRVVVLAQEEARLQNHNYIGTEHILLGLIHEGDGVAAKVLASLDISLEAVRLQVEEIVGHGSDSPKGHIPFTPAAKEVFELSLGEAHRLGHDDIGTEHILLGIVREGEGVAAQVLVKLGADLSRVHQRVIQLVAEEPESASNRWPDVEFGEDSSNMYAERGPHGIVRGPDSFCRPEPATRKDRLLRTCRRRVPNFMVGWTTWFRNRRAVGLRGDLIYLRDTLRRRITGE